MDQTALSNQTFFGTSPNAVKTQIWIAVGVYVFITIINKQLGLGHSLYPVLQVLSTSLFEKIPIPLVFQHFSEEIAMNEDSNQTRLFNIEPETRSLSES